LKGNLGIGVANEFMCDRCLCD